jgi:hypothetical protein
MEFHVRIAAPLVDIGMIERQLLELDPAGLVDLRGADLLRVSTCIHHAELVGVLDAAGYPVPYTEVEAQPSVCCGGCSG